MPDPLLRELTPDEIRTFHEDGVVCARDLFPPEWIARMQTAVDQAIAEPTPYGRT